MKKKNIIAAALASSIALSATFTGCTLVTSNNKEDMAQVVATVNITQADKFKNNAELAAYSSAINDTEIVKRNLVSYFINVGYSYIQNYGYSYEETFNLLLDALVNNSVLVQYSTVRLLMEKAEEPGNSAQSVLAEFTDESKPLSERYVYLLGGEDNEDVLLAKYNLYSSLNSAIDGYEKTIIEEDTEYTGTATRTTPTNLNTEQDDYFPKTEDGKLDYYVYTGFEGYLLGGSGTYKDDALEGTTSTTRKKAYNRFLVYLRDSNLIDEDDKGNLKDILKFNYIEDEYVSQLETRIINKYYDLYENEQKDSLLDDEYDYIQSAYDSLLADQTKAYGTASAFESALGSMSSSSFVLYSPDTTDAEFDYDGDYGTNYGRFGFVYNILLPFNAKQSARLSELNSVLSADDKKDYYYAERNKLLKEIETVDQRSAWFNGATDYSFKASEKGIQAYGASDYLFFEGNLTDSGESGKYKKLQAYDGRYSYNGSVYENENGSYTLLGNKLNIDSMLKEFSSYINYVLTGEKDGGKVNFDNGYNPDNGNEKYYQTNSFVLEDDKDEIDYSKFLYASGNVDFGAPFNKSNLLNSQEAPDQYKAMSAVNELQFAYTTDTSVLSQYIGYSVSAYDTSYIKEFEYAAKLAISKGEGGFAVCAGDYGWHIIYVTYVFDAGATYEPDWSKISVEGTFENLFFEWIKSNDLSDLTSWRRSKLINDFNKEDVSIIKYQNRYQDLLDLGNE